MSHADDLAGTTTGNRRDFLYYATAGAGVVATGAAVWPLVNQMNPSDDVKALASIEVDISGVAEGTQLKVLWRGKPVFVRHRTADEIKSARDAQLSDLVDGNSENDNLPGTDASDANRALDKDGKWLVMVGVCTHLGCIPLGDAGEFGVNGASAPGAGGWFCPCHGSQYDTSGRIRKGPAPRNLLVPVAAFITETTIKLG